MRTKNQRGCGCGKPKVGAITHPPSTPPPPPPSK